MGSVGADLEQTLPDGPKIVELTAEDKANGRYSPLALTRALEGLHQDGLVLLRGVIDVDHIDALNKRMCADADARIADPSQGYNHGVKSNFLQRPPTNEADLLFEDVYFNPYVLQIANTYLGPRPVWNWLTSNTAIANTKGMRQPVHKDCSFPNPLFPYYFIANVPLCDFTVENGATEFWLGSHAHTTSKDNVIARTPEDCALYGRIGDPIPNINEDALKARMQVRPPVQPEARRGDIVIRDLRTWHAGMPNSSDSHRIMLGLGYMSQAHPNYLMRTYLPAAQRAFFLGKAPQDKVEVRANLCSDEEMDKLTMDSYFELRPTYLD